ncbi:hypothetical protein QN277_016477 [Acacia crassicarpa]|uniref:AAA+ ATPase domain-containing protein n=1 Tax=Acacia crassicarpa TaxID=499986 RepID=A0AAE1TAJ4_9FABA|nr:hypothetical protein QN277_016477 [Acacia crassicarpa]
MDVVVSVATTILEKLVDEAILQACYPFRFNKYVKELETEKKHLQSKIQDVQYRAKDAQKKTHKVVHEVESWLNDANTLMANVVDLQEKTKRNKTSCLKLCPNLINRYNLAKRLEEKTNEIKTHNQVHFSKFSRLATLVGMNYFPSQDFVDFYSRKIAYKHLLRALKDDKIHTIGLYGMGGSGKTTLVTEVGREVENFFDKVLFVVVSNNYDVRKIQTEISDQLSFELKEEGHHERARRLCMRLSGGEKFLIILDDVWEKLDLMDIGIPTANNQMGCTILITTRKLPVCESMSCQEKIRLEALNEDESWALFQRHAGLFDYLSDNLKDVAQNITKVCDGLPVAIAAVANTLKNIPHGEWVEALEILRNPCLIDIEEGLKSTYGCLRLSYDNLENEALKSLFLLCSVYPEDYKIPIGELTIIGLGLGLLGEIPSYRVGTQMINKAIKKLIDSCLLQKAADQNRGGDIKMHDLVRDVANWIANKENKLITGPLKDNVIMEDHAVRYLWFEKVDKCPNKLYCPKLEFLHISIYSESFVTIPKDFFSGTEKLRALTLASPTYKEDLVLQLPISLNLINNLRCLTLYRWVLGDISFIGSLERLESLTIWGCSFDELPTCIIEQKQLRLLYLHECKIQRNPFAVMGRCSQLEVLYFLRNEGKDWEDQNNNSAKFFDKISTTTLAMESYCIQFGNRWRYCSMGEIQALNKDFGDCKSFVARGLHNEDFESCISIGTSKDMMRRAKTLSLRRIPESLKNIIPDLWRSIGGGMNELTCLALHDSNGIECVVGQSNPSQVGIISNLTHLSLSKVKHLKTLYNGQPPEGLFANLEELCIDGCDSLEHIMTEDVKEIVDASDYQSYKNAFPKLNRLQIYGCKKLEYLMPISFAKSVTQLESLSVYGNNELRSMFGPSSEDLNSNKPQTIEFPALKHLGLYKLPNIISICPKNYHPTWSSLKSFQLTDCPLLYIKSVIHWVASGGLRQEDNHMTSEDLLKVVVASMESLEFLNLCNHEVEVVFDVEQLSINRQQVNSKLRCLLLNELPQLTHIWKGTKFFLLLQHLDSLQVVSCANLKQVFPSSIWKSLPQLKTLCIEDSKELEDIIEEEDDQNVSNSSRQLIFPKLVSITIKRCHKLKCVLPNISACQAFPNLRELYIEDATALEQVFGHEQDDTTLEYVIFWNLPSLTSVAPSIDLQTVKYIVVLQCPKLSLASSVTPREFLEQVSKGYFTEYYTFKMGLENIIKSMDDSSKETMQQINCQETGGQSNDQKLTIIATPNLTENEEESEDRSVHEREMSKEKSVEGRVEECSTSENVQIVTTLAHSKLASSTKSVNQIMPALEISAVIPTSSPRPQSISKQLTTNPAYISMHQTPSTYAELVNTISTSQFESKYQQQQSLEKNEITKKSIGDLEGQSAQKENISRENDVKGISEDSLSFENAKIIALSIDSKLATSSTKSVSHIQSQIKFNRRKSDAEDLKDDDLIGMLESMEDDYSGESPILYVPTVATTKDELVAKALADLEDSLKMPIKDIATLDANSLRLQTALNFLSRLSLEDGALSHGVMAVIKSMRKDLPIILSSFRQAFATVNKFAVFEERDKSIKDELTQQKEVAIALVSKMSKTQMFMDEAQEKEARLKEQISLLEKQRKDFEAELLSLQEQKRKYIAKTFEFKKEIETMRKEKSKMVEDQRNARQQLFEVEYKWSILISQFEQETANRNLS